MAKYQVRYSGYYIIEANTADEALDTTRDDAEVEYEEWENEEVLYWGEGDD